MNTFKSNLDMGIDQYLSLKQEGDMDLIGEVRNILVDSGLGNKLEEAFDTHPHVVEARNKPSQVQRYLMNRYWNTQLMIHAHKSSEQRYYLIPNGSVQQWLDLFRTAVVPFLIEHNLPVRIQ